MTRVVPVWVLVLIVFVLALLTVPLLTTARLTAQDKDRFGVPGRVVYEIANFPLLARSVYQELLFRSSDEIDDRFIRAQKDSMLDFSGLAPVPTADGFDLPGLLQRGSGGLPGWRFLTGAFRLNGVHENAVLLMSPNGEIVHNWIIDEVPIGDWTPRRKGLKVPHGMDVTPDGSILVVHDPVSSLQRFDSCGERLWAAPGRFHHSVTLGPEGDTAWSFDLNDLVEVALKDGAVLRRITTDEIMKANPGIDVFELRRQHATYLGENRRNTDGVWMNDPIHFNDIEPLPAGLSDAFEGFEPGDILLSSRSTNGLVVVDPDTLKIKWWRLGAVQRQHDPDWLPNGEILVYNNRMSRDHSEIVSLDPQSFERRVSLDGEDHAFYSRIRGRQQALPNGGMIVTSPQQGRVFETAGSPDAPIAYELFNFNDEDQQFTYVISEVKWFPPDTFNMDMFSCE